MVSHRQRVSKVTSKAYAPKWVEIHRDSIRIICSEGQLPLQLGEGNKDGVLNNSRSSVASAPEMNPGLARICLARAGSSCAGGIWPGFLGQIYESL